MVLVIDGSSVLHRVHATPQSDVMSGDVPSGNISGFLKSLATICRYDRSRNGLVIAWDSGVPLFRRELFRNYKKQKMPIGQGVKPQYLSDHNLDPTRDMTEDEEEKSQKYTTAREILHAHVLPKLGCLSVRAINCEADDIISYWVHKTQEDKNTIYSSDRDLIQLIKQGSVDFFDTRQKKNFDELTYVSSRKLELNFWKLFFVLEKALLGGEDGIPRIPGITPIPAAHFANEIARNIYLKFRGEVTEETLEQVIRNDVTIPLKGTKRQDNLDTLKTDYTIQMLCRNYYLMDLSYPIRKKLEICDDIRNEITRGILNISIDEYAVEDLLDGYYITEGKAGLGYITEANVIDDLSSRDVLFNQREI